MDKPSLPVTDSNCLVTRTCPEKDVQPAETNATTGRMDDSFSFGCEIPSAVRQSITRPDCSLGNRNEEE